MQIQMAVSTLLLTSLFAIPAQAIENDETDKKRRATANIVQGKASNPPTQPGVEAFSQADKDIEFEGVPAGYYKKLDLNSF